MKSDVTYSHSKNIGEEVSNFCGTPIRIYNDLEMELDVLLDVQRTVIANKEVSAASIPAEVMPGEVHCSDNIIRRETTAEAIGYDAFKREAAPLIGLGFMVYNYDEGAWVRKDGNLRQSTAEELSTWLNAVPSLPDYTIKRDFVTSVEADGENKLLIARDSSGKVLYAFRYIGGFPGNYMGGEEVRPFDPPQLSVRKSTASRVIQYLDSGNKCQHGSIVPVEYPDEWEQSKRFAPTSSVSRSTIGGTALFDELKLAISATKPEIELAQPQTCEWYPDGETRCTEAVVHAATKDKAGMCSACFALRLKTR
jgi:hypothetical protein